MPDDEGEALFLAALRAGASSVNGTFVEIGAWCGKSTVYLGAAAEETGAVPVQSGPSPRIRGEPGRLGAPRPTLVDPDDRIDTLPHWRRTDRPAPISSRRWWASWAIRRPCPPTGRHRWPSASSTAGHGEEPAWADYRGWSPHVMRDGWLAIHDVFPDPADGGRPPYDIWRAALESGEFVEDGEWDRCGCCRRL